MTRSLDQYPDIAPEQYVMVDISQKKTLSPFVQKLPTIVANYFLSNMPTIEFDTSSKADDNEFFEYVHLSGSTLYTRMKSVLNIARERLLGSYHVSAMGIALLRCITYSLQRTIGDCVAQNMFTPSFRAFVRSVLGVLSPTFSVQLATKFLTIQPSADAPQLADLTIRGAMILIISLILNSPTNDQVLPFCVAAVKSPFTISSARLLVAKVLQLGHPKLSQRILDLLEDTEDAFLLLEFLDAMTSTPTLQSIMESEKVIEFRNILMKRLNITLSPIFPDVFFIEAISVDKQKFSPLSIEILTAIEQIPKVRFVKEIQELLRKRKDATPLILRTLSMSYYITTRPVAEIVVTELCHMLRDRASTETASASRFELRACDFALPIAQSLVGRLLTINFIDLATKLLVEMLPVLADDAIPLHWVVLFTSRFRSLLPTDILFSLSQLVASLTDASELFVTGDDQIGRIVKILVKRYRLVLRDPDMINREYPSPYLHAQAFAHCALALSQLSDREIASVLVTPLFTISPSPNKDMAALCLAKLAASLSSNIAYQFFELIMNHEARDLAMCAGRLFLSRARIDVMKRICQKCSNMINGNPTKLDYFMRMIAPSYQRLRGEEPVAGLMLAALLQNVNEKTPKGLQEGVIDLVSFIYMRLKLVRARRDLINAATKFSPELRAIIPGSLPLSFTKNGC
jgi:hypothetical protein